MNIVQIEENVQKLLNPLNNESFIYDLLQAYGKPKASIARLKNGTHNLSKNKNEVLWKKQLFFISTDIENLLSFIDDVRKNNLIINHQPRFIIVTNFKSLLAVDTKTQDTLDIDFNKLGKNFDFFLPWAGMEKAQHKIENPADVKAAEKMAKLYDEILKDNPVSTNEELHLLNVFLSRLLFCFFSEDTEIFLKGSFTNSIKSHTQADGSDLDTYLKRLFEVLNNPDRDQYPHYLKAFPYVNGGLFTDKIHAPKFSRRSRTLIIECGELDWSAINPDIFGSMFQAVVHIDQRAEMGMHYTSVPNIMKVIEPLFLNELKEEFENHYEHENKLERLLLRLENLKIFDPACGSGNFLIIAYKEIRTLEMKILQRINQLSKNKAARFSNITLTQFYGIELDDFAHEIAILSLWLAEHQMNVKFKEIFGTANPSLPLKKGGTIVCGNAAQISWNSVCENFGKNEIYVLGNPPYLGSTMQNHDQKLDLKMVCKDFGNYKNLDYISCWFVKGANYIKNTRAKLAFVSTNSICQGEQVGLLWPHLLRTNLEIFFAHQSFKWANNAKSKAGVTCVIIGIRNSDSGKKIIFNNILSSKVDHINAYLTQGHSPIVVKRSTPLSELPIMENGNKAVDGGNLIISNDMEREELIKRSPQSAVYIKEMIGSKEFIQGSKRWCLWIKDNQASQALAIECIYERVNKVRSVRLASTDKGANDLSDKPYRFRDQRMPITNSLFIPSVSSERRDYLPIGYLNSDVVIVAPNFGIFDAPLYTFGVISSKLHMIWIRAVAGRLRSDYRYSSSICYNTFPLPHITQGQKDDISRYVMNILNCREKHPEKTISELYDPDKMPPNLLEAHQKLDVAVEQCYRSIPFSSDEQRLEFLFKLYEEMTNNEKRKSNA